MSRPVSSAASRPVLKSPLRTATMSLLGPPVPGVVPGADPGPDTAPAPEITAQQLRRMQISEFTAWLRTQTNKHKRPLQQETIIGYAETARVLDRWMAEQEVDEDFRACDSAVLNEFFAATGALTARAGRTRGSATCTTSSRGSPEGTAIQTRGPTTSCGTAR